VQTLLHIAYQNTRNMLTLHSALHRNWILWSCTVFLSTF